MDHRVDARGLITTYQYDNVDREIERGYQDGTLLLFEYDKVGNRKVMVDVTGGVRHTYTYDYDNVNRTTLAVDPNAEDIAYTYNGVGQRTTMVDPDGGTFTYLYDTVGRLGTIVNPYSETTTLVYDDADRQTGTIHGNTTKTTIIYDAASHRTGVINANSSNTTLSYYLYAHDWVGNRTSVWENGTDVSNWNYDRTDQLIDDIVRPATTAVNWYGLTLAQWGLMSADGWYNLPVDDIPTGGAGFLEYDSRGNRETQLDAVTGDITTLAYDDANRLLWAEDVSGITTYTFDENGNQTSIEDPSNDITTSTWNGENRLIEVEHPDSTITEYRYNPDGLRVSQDHDGIVTLYVYDGNNLLQETDDVGLAEAEYTFIPQPYAKFVSQRRDTESSFYMPDGIRNVRQLTDDGQVVTDDDKFDAFGNRISSTGSTSNFYAYNGECGYRDDSHAGPDGELSTHHRNISSKTGRFTSEDPAEDDHNLYRPVGNNPVNRQDPSGLDENRGDVSLAPLKPLLPKQIGGLYDLAPPLKEESLDQWLAALGYKLEGSRKEAWQQFMLAKAGITAAEIRDYRDFSPKNQAIMKRIYGYYTDVFVANPELLWAGMAKLAGNSVWNGLEMGDSFKPLSQLAPGGGPTKLIDAMQQELVKMNLEIIMDLGWVHEAYVTGGMDEIERLRSGKLLGRDVYSAFKDIHGGKLEGDQDRINNGNAALLEREQSIILRRGYRELALLQDKGLDQGMAENSISPIPGGKDFLDVVPGGDLTTFDDRWRWIETDMLPKWLAFSPAERLTLVQQPLGATPTALRNALLRDLADGLRSFLQHRKTDAEKIKEALNGPHP